MSTTQTPTTSSGTTSSSTTDATSSESSTGEGTTDETSTSEGTTGETTMAESSSGESSSGGESSSSSGGAALYELLDPEVEQFDMMYPEWAGAWWQWMYAQAATNHPLLDDTGTYCDTGQDEPVFFLGGTFGGAAVTRTCTVPSENAVFFPIVNATWDNAGVPKDMLYTDEELMAGPVDFVDAMDDYSLEIDGDSYDMTALADYRVGLYQSTYVIPDEDSLYDLWGVDFAGLVDPTYGDGIYVMIQFEPGDHDVHFYATDDEGGFTVDVTYELTVE